MVHEHPYLRTHWVYRHKMCFRGDISIVSIGLETTTVGIT